MLLLFFIFYDDDKSMPFPAENNGFQWWQPMRLLVCCVTGRARLFSTMYQKAPCPDTHMSSHSIFEQKRLFFRIFPTLFSFFHFFPTFFHFFPFFSKFLQKPSKSPKVAFFEARPPHLSHNYDVTTSVHKLISF